MRIALAALAATLLASCAPVQWVKPDAAPGQFEADLTDCRNQAWQETRMRFAFYHPVAPAVATDSLGRRFLVYPYGPFADPFGQQFMEESRLADFCMHNKGWSLQQVSK
jgi:hypothetical protein